MTKIKEFESEDLRNQIESQERSALGDWYLVFREKDIENLDDEDICRACRQSLFPDRIAPTAISRLSKEPLAGEMFEGEMLVSLKGIPRSFWLKNNELRKKLQNILNGVKGQLHEDMADDVAKLESLVAEP